MLTCEKCGWESPDYAAFCTNCGNRLNAPSSKASEDEFRFNAQISPTTDESEAGGATRSEKVDEGRQPSVNDDPAPVLGDSELSDPDSENQGAGYTAPTLVGVQANSLNEKPTSEQGTAPPKGAVQAKGTPQGIQGGPVQGNRTLVDLTTPDFRAMVELAQKGKDGEALHELVNAVEQGSADVVSAPSDYNPGEVLVAAEVDSADPSGSIEARSEPESEPNTTPSDDAHDNESDGVAGMSPAAADAHERPAESGSQRNDGRAPLVFPDSREPDECPPSDSLASGDQVVNAEDAASTSTPNDTSGATSSQTSESTLESDSATPQASTFSDSSDVFEQLPDLAEPSSVGLVSSGGSIRDLGSLDVNIEMLESSDVLPTFGEDDSVFGDEHEELSSVDLNPVEMNDFDVGEPRASIESNRNGDSPPPIPVHRGQFMLRCLSTGMHHNRTAALGAEPTIIGRTEGTIQIQQDQHLSNRHVRVVTVDDGVRVEDMASMNGTWRRVRNTCRLTVGDAVLLGSRIFELRTFTAENVQPRSETQTLALGIEVDRSGLVIAEMAKDGMPVSIHNLPTDGLRIGRQSGDVILSDDPFLSAVHAFIAPHTEGGAELKDLSGGNGCWVRLTESALLKVGDAFLIGQTVWRVGEFA